MADYISPFFEKIGIANYGIMMALGLLTAIVLFWAFCKYLKVEDKTYNFYSMNIIISIIAGLGFAWLFQAFYNLFSGGSFFDGGITFMGGLIGGAAVFFLATIFFAQPSVKHDLPQIVGIAAPCIAAGHSLGRIGCFLAGCCYGVHTDSWIGVVFKHNGGADGLPRVPTQLIEAIFLALLFAVLLALLLKRRNSKYLMVIYMLSYSVFRFILEFWRDDDRGTFALISPSQIQSIIMFLGGIALFVVVYVLKKVPYAHTGIPEPAAETTDVENGQSAVVEDNSLSEPDNTENNENDTVNK